MPKFRDFVFGPWRAVAVLGVTQILAWGALFYPPVLMMPLIAAERGWSLFFAMSGFSLALAGRGILRPDRRRPDRPPWRPCGHGRRRIARRARTGLLTLASHPAAYLATWIILGVAISATLYDPAFATLGRIFGHAARRPITALTLAGGFASTVSWPATQFFLSWTDWKTTYLIFAGLLALVAAPLHAFLLPRTRAAAQKHFDANVALPSAPLPSRGLAFHPGRDRFRGLRLRAVRARRASAGDVRARGHRSRDRRSDRRAVRAVSGRRRGFCEFIFASNVHPLIIARFALAMLLAGFALLALFGFWVPIAMVFAIMFGAANGLITITRGAVPLALFGAAGYGRLLGRIAKPFQIMQALAPVVLAFVVERLSGSGRIGAGGRIHRARAGCMAAIRRPAARR